MTVIMYVLKNVNVLLYSEVIYVVTYPSSTKFYKVATTMEFHVISWRDIQTTYVYDIITL